MSKRKRVALLAVAFLLISPVMLWKISRSSTFQFFGEIIPRVDTSQKVVALTLDDGPTATGTDQILTILAEENVKATFFVIGSDLERNLEQARKIVAAGHELGNHSYSHVRMLLVTSSFVKQEIESTDKLIRAAGYQGEILFRPPYGKKLFALPYYLSKTGRKTITADVAPDSDRPAVDADEITQNVLSNTRPGSIIVMHVMYPNRAESMKAVKKIVAGLKAQGYSFKTMSELLKETEN